MSRIKIGIICGITKQENYNEMMNYFENMMSFLGWDEMDHNASFDGWLESQGLA